MNKVLLYGGTFDPPHLGHVHIPKEAMEYLSFDRVLYVPAFQSPLKETAPMSASHRVAMLTLALADCPWATINTLEIERGNTSFTIDTIEELLGSYDEIRLLLGADQWAQFQQWHRWEDILDIAHPAILPREGFDIDDDRVLPIRQLPNASTTIREQICLNEAWESGVLTEVAQYIKKYKLYL